MLTEGGTIVCIMVYYRLSPFWDKPAGALPDYYEKKEEPCLGN